MSGSGTNNRTRVFQALHDLIYDAIGVQLDGVGDPATSDQNCIVSICRLGIPLPHDEYANPWSPENPEGSVAMCERYARLIDSAPLLMPEYDPTANSIEAMYGQIVQAEVLAGNYSQGDLASNSPLYVQEEAVTPSGGSEKVYALSAAHRDFLAREEVYSQLRFAYALGQLQQEYEAATGGDEYPAYWNDVAAIKQGRVKTAQSSLEAVPSSLAAAVQQLRSYGYYGVAQLFQSARRTWEASKRSSILAPAQGSYWRMCLPNPYNWYENDAYFTDVVIKEANLRLTPGSYAAGDVPMILHVYRYFPGLDKWLGEAVSVSSETEFVEIRCKLARISFQRPWLDTSLFSLKGWRVPGRDAGAYSTGNRSANTGIFPLLPMSVVVCRDLSITANWSTSDKSSLKLTTYGKWAGICGIGPFQVAHTTENGTHSYATLDDDTLTVPGTQIVAWISSLNPLCPPAS